MSGSEAGAVTGRVGVRVEVRVVVMLGGALIVASYNRPTLPPGIATVYRAGQESSVTEPLG